MPFIEHDLKTLLSDMPHPFLQSEVKTIMIQLLSAMAHCHANWIVGFQMGVTGAEDSCIAT
jgi:cell division cycle 2-like protein